MPVCTLTAPKQTTDLRVGAWSRTGSLISGGTHMRHRVPCCGKWHSSTRQMTGMTELLWLASQVTPQRRPLRGVQRSWPTRTHPVTQAGQSMGFKARHPALHRSAIFPKQVGDLCWQLWPPVTSSSYRATDGRIATHRTARFLVGWPGAQRRHPQ